MHRSAVARDFIRFLAIRNAAQIRENVMPGCFCGRIELQHRRTKITGRCWIVVFG